MASILKCDCSDSAITDLGCELLNTDMNRIPSTRSGNRGAHVHMRLRTTSIQKKNFYKRKGLKTRKSASFLISIVSRSQYILIWVNCKVNGGSRLNVLGGHCCLSNRHWGPGIWLSHWCESREWRFWMRAHNERDFYFPCPWQNNNDAHNDWRMETSSYKYRNEIKILRFSHQCFLSHGPFLR
jgi:hypothetical protein